MQKTRARRCQVPIRTRRRQSDAKWRASVASCYETLKFVIPNGKTLPKRKASKSLVLQETEKHIGNLERAISRLLNIEAHEQGQGVLWRKGENWFPAMLEDFQNDFAKQQRSIFHQSSQGRRCYNMLHDIQEEIINMSVDCNHLAFLPLGGADTPTPTQGATPCTRRHKVSKARCRYETERASQRILSAYITGDMVNAVIPSSTPSATTTTSMDPDHPQAVPTTPNPSQGHGNVHSGLYSGRTVHLQKVGNMFVPADRLYRRESGEFPPLNSISALDRMVLKRSVETEQHVHTVHEVELWHTTVLELDL
ncbi:uncharacterized protein LOC143301525 [Babylonia areolata]|uniref:uncharacterized protein LOC143301525 n=1 Tax=Babylonia areolata TaxID=304850 RepID=UPI003FD0CF01